MAPGPSLGFPKTFRLTQKKDFEYMRERSRKCSAPPLIGYVKDSRMGAAHARLGLSVSKKQGSAVRRNRIKRVLRDEFRLSQEARSLHVDLMVVAAQPVQDMASLRQALREILACAARVR